MDTGGGVAGSMAQQGETGGATTAAQASGGVNPSFWQKLMPMAGGMGGSAAGLAIGGALAPETGGLSLIPGLLAAGLGGAAGGAAGKAAENATMPGTAIDSGVLGSAVGQGIGNAAGFGVGEGLSALGSKFAAPLLEKGAAKFLAGQVPAGSVTPDLAHTLTDMGFSDINKAGDFADVLTGKAVDPLEGNPEEGEGKALLNNAVEDLVNTNAPQKIPIDDIGVPKPAKPNIAAEVAAKARGSQLQQVIDQNGLTDTQANELKTNLSALQKPYTLDADGNASPGDVLKYQRDVAAKADQHWTDYKKSGNTNLDSKKMAQAYSDVADILSKRMSTDNIPVPVETQKALADDILEYGAPINPTAAQKMAEEVQQPGMTVSKLRSIQSKWVTVKNAIKQGTLQKAKTFGTSAADIIPTTPTGAIGKAGKLLTASPTIDKAAAKSMGGIANMLTSPTNQRIVQTLAKIGGAGLANTPNMISAPAGGGNIGGTVNPAAANSAVTTGQGATGQTSLSNLYQQLMANYQADPNNASTASTLSTINTLAPLLQKQSMASSLLSNLPSAFAQAGGAQGPLGGLETRLTAMIPGTPAYEYQKQAQAASAALASLLGVAPGAVTAGMPQFMETPATAQPQISNIQNLLSTLPAPATGQ